MYCRKCGTEVQSEHEEYCKSCNTQNDHVSVGIGSASQSDRDILGGAQSDFRSTAPEQVKKDIFFEEDSIKPADPIDFLLEETPEPAISESKTETIDNVSESSDDSDPKLTDDFDFSSLNEDSESKVDDKDESDDINHESTFSGLDDDESISIENAIGSEQAEDQDSENDENPFDWSDDEVENSDESDMMSNWDADEESEPEEMDEPIFGYIPDNVPEKSDDEPEEQSKPDVKDEEIEQVNDLTTPEEEETENSQPKEEIITDTDLPISELFDDTENKKLTQKIDLEKVKQEIESNPELTPPKLDIPKANNLSTKKIPILSEVRKPKGVAYIKGNTLTFSGGFKPFSGQELNIEDKVFQIKTKLTNPMRMYGIIGSGIVAFLLFIFIISSFIGSSGGQIAGVVYGSNGATALADQVVKLKELDRTTTTNHAGFFVFEDLKSGVYTLQYIDNGLVVNERTITVLEEKTSTIILGDSGSQTSLDEGYIVKDVASSPPVQAAVMALPAASKTIPGKLKLSLSPSSAKAYLNDKPLGTGSRTYNVKPGIYTLDIERNGYYPESKTITIRSGSALSYSFGLVKDERVNMNTSELYSKAYDYEIAGNYSDAINYYNKSLANKPNNVKALIGKARCMSKQGNIDGALTTFVQASRAAGNSNDLNSKIEAINGIISIRPNNYTAYYDRGEAYYSLKDYKKSVADFKKVVLLDKRNLKAYYNLGDSYFAANRYNEALLAYQGAEALHFADPKAQVQIAKTNFILGDMKNAKKAYLKFNEMASLPQILEYENDSAWKNIVDTFSQKD